MSLVLVISSSSFCFFFFLRGCNFLFDSLIFQSSGFQTLVKVLGF